MYRNQEYNIFISYRGSTNGALLASKLYTDLLHYSNSNKEKEYKPFFAPVCIPKGEDFKQAICDVMKDVLCVILVLSKDFFNCCTNEDDMVYYELKQALQKGDINFIPVIMNDFSFDSEKQLINCFDTEEIDRMRHINPIKYYGIYDFSTEVDLVPVLVNVFKNKVNLGTINHQMCLDISDYHLGTGKIIEFGRYPQSVVSDVTLIEKIVTGMFNGETVLNNNNRLRYSNLELATITENPFNKTHFDNGKAVISGSRNYYLVEPIKWIVLYMNEDFLYLMSEKLIDAIQFNLNRVNHRDEKGVYYNANNWEMSYIRRWLNNDFYYDAFADDERQRIVTVKIDNSNNSSHYETKCNDTIDNVFLISHKEIMATKYGEAFTTDFARARGAYSSTSSSHGGHGDWWTRSPGNKNDSVENIDRRGCIDAVPFCNYVDDTAAGVRVCIVIRRSIL